MKNILYILTIVLITLVSCDDVFETDVDNTFGDKYTWEIAKYTTGVLMEAYQEIPHSLDHYDNNFLDCATDNAVTQSTSSKMAQLGAGQLSPLTNHMGNWSKAYNQIQNINLFLKEGGLNDESMIYHRDIDISDGFKARLKGEALFLRAWWTSELLRVYGGVSNTGEALGVPVFTEFLDADSVNITGSLKRPTYEQTVEQIFADCDSAFNYLPMDYDSAAGTAYSPDHDGRADKKMCIALKARVALYAASPAYQPDGISTDNVKEKWERAARLAYTAIEKGELGTFQALDESVMFSKQIGTEYIFSFMIDDRSYETQHLPPSVFGNGRTNPSQNLVDAFPCSDGLPINESPLYNPQDPYNNRDIRLSRTVLHNGAPIDALGIPLAVYYNADLGIPATDAPGKFYNNTRSGYYLRKWVSSKEQMLLVGNLKKDFHRVPLLRRAEMYLNLAEALNNAAGPEGTVDGCGAYTAYQIISDIRFLSGGIFDNTYLNNHRADKEKFNEIILNERRIELAFEGHRYFDLRRTNSDLTSDVYGMTCVKENDSIIYTGTVAGIDNSDIVIEKRPLGDEKYRYAPIPYDEIIENPEMVNNKGW